MAEHAAHDAHIYTGTDDLRCICVTAGTEARCPNPAAQDGLCQTCLAARLPQQPASFGVESRRGAQQYDEPKQRGPFEQPDHAPEHTPLSGRAI